MAITNKSKLSYISDLVSMYDLFRKKIKCNDLFVMTIKRILALDEEKLIFKYYYNFKRECYKRLGKEIY